MTSRPDIVATLFGLGEIYDKKITDDLVRIWNQVLDDLTPVELALAVKQYVLSPESKFFPKPGQLFGLARPQFDDEAEAALIADRIFFAVRSYGTDAIGMERAQKRIGDVGWAWVQNAGGWHALVSGIKSEDDIPILKSQCRKSIVAVIHRQKNNMPMEQLGHQPAVTLKSLGIDMKSIPHDK